MWLLYTPDFFFYYGQYQQTFPVTFAKIIEGVSKENKKISDPPLETIMELTKALESGGKIIDSDSKKFKESLKKKFKILKWIYLNILFNPFFVKG